MYGVAKRGTPGDFYGECGRAFGLRSATGSLGLTSGDGSLESSPVRPGCYLSIYLSIFYTNKKVITDMPDQIWHTCAATNGECSCGGLEGLASQV